MGGDVVEVDWGIHRGSESGTCLHSNRSFWLAPAHEGMENETWSLEVFGCGWCHPSPLDSGLRRNDEWGAGLTKGCREWRMRGCWSGLSRIGVRDMLSQQSLIPAGAGTPRYEKPELWLGKANWHGGICYAPPQPQRGTSPRATFSHSAIGHWFTIRHVSPVGSRHRG